MDSDFFELFENIRINLDQLDEEREEILRENRKIIRKCSEVIKSIHRNELNGLSEEIAEIQNKIVMLKEISTNFSEVIGRNYLTTVRQEFTEAVILYKYAVGENIPNYDEIGVNSYEYLLGLADFIGELYRMVLNSIRENDVIKAEKIYETMEELYQYLFKLDYPSGMLPGFRKKVDNARNLSRKTLELITTSKNLSILNKNIEESLKK